MIEQLIKRTNEPDFFGNSRFQLVNSFCQSGNSNICEFNFVLEEFDVDGKIKSLEHWRINTFQTLIIENIFAETYMPYVRVNVLEDHPLLWRFIEDELECELKGFPENVNEFIGELYFEFEKVTGNWISLDKYFFSTNEYYKKNKRKTLLIPKPLKEIIAKVCIAHNVDFEVKNTVEANKNGYSSSHTAKILLFGNELISPNTFKLGQPYIIAENFAASVIK